MTLNDLMLQSYGWGDSNAGQILLASLLLPLVGTVLAWIGKGGKTDADGRFIASTVMAVALFAALLEVAAIFVARSVHGASVLDANALLLISPILCLAGSIVGIRMVFPLSELGSVRMVADMGAFLLICLALVWLFSRFRGWGIVFVGTFTQLIAVSVVALFFLRRLYRRAFGLDRAAPRAMRPSME